MAGFYTLDTGAIYGSFCNHPKALNTRLPLPVMCNSIYLAQYHLQGRLKQLVQKCVGRQVEYRITPQV